jgi:hypothetical protein
MHDGYALPYLIDEINEWLERFLPARQRYRGKYPRALAKGQSRCCEDG